MLSVGVEANNFFHMKLFEVQTPGDGTDCTPKI
jgi:hypothetical protein